MQQSATGSTPNDDGPVSVHNGRGRDIPDIGRNGHRPLSSSSSPDQDSNSDMIRNISLKRLGVAAMANSINNNLNHNSNDSNSSSGGGSDSGSPLNLSGDVDDSRPDSSVGTCDSKVRTHTLIFPILCQNANLKGKSCYFGCFERESGDFSNEVQNAYPLIDELIFKSVLTFQETGVKLIAGEIL